MTNHMTDGVLLPDHVAGHPALELCNTRAAWGSSKPREYLMSYDALAVWAGEHALLSLSDVTVLRAEAAIRPQAARAVVHETVEFRDQLYAVVAVPSNEVAGSALHAVGRKVARAISAAHFATAADGRVQWQAARSLRAPLDAVALSAMRLLADYGVDAVGRCPGEGCGWLFLDPSRRRRWCTMAICGNRAKARGHRARQRIGYEAASS